MNNYVSTCKLKNLFMCSLAVKGVYSETSKYTLINGGANTMKLLCNDAADYTYSSADIQMANTKWLPCKET